MRRASWYVAATVVVLAAAAGAARCVSSQQPRPGRGNHLRRARWARPCARDPAGRIRRPAPPPLSRSSTSSTAYPGRARRTRETTGSSTRSRKRGRRSSSSPRARATATPTRSISTGVAAETGRPTSPPNCRTTSMPTFGRSRTASGRAIAGVSAGGYGAAVTGLNHLDRFSVIESWSGYFHPTDPTGTRALARGTARDRASADRRVCSATCAAGRRSWRSTSAVATCDSGPRTSSSTES